ncbi:MAG TPA: prolipoprotein diacylglyceryl transferase [Burkholderiales bacterium]|nr:prolipoprotein diacylglyceryl transferase [Burkholderiales bacterium]
MPLVHPDFNPIAIQLGPLAVRWYGLMYLLGFALLWFLGRYRIKHQPWVGFTAKELEDLIFHGVLGVIIGGRLGYVLFYKLGYYLANPLEIFAIWQGGMSFHGGFLGVLVAMWLFARRYKKDWLATMDFLAPLVPPGLAAGRMGNFINGELPGRATDASWGMIFPQVGDNIARHPSQLYQFAMEGLLLFVIVWIYSLKPRPRGAVAGAFLLGYGVFRFIAEYFREPDNFLGLLALGFSMGQWLSLPMIIGGIALIVWAYRQQSGTRDFEQMKPARR